MGTPRDFELDPIDPRSRPNPAPPRYLKRQIYTDPKVFKVIDKHAVDVSIAWIFLCSKNDT